HNAIFIPNTGGVGGNTGGGTGATPPTPGLAIPISLIGGAPVGAVKPPVSCVAGSPNCTCTNGVCTTPAPTTSTAVSCVKGTPGCVCVPTVTGEVCTKPSATPICGALPLPACLQDPKQPRTGRLSWREQVN
ncbi:MAG: hypothetical protein ACXW1C_01295, partial [Gallionella sp.]